MPLVFLPAKAVKYWDGSSWVGSQDFGKIKMWNGSDWQYIGIRPYADIPLVTFDPDGGTVGSPTILTDYQFGFSASVTITASSSVVWDWAGGDGFNGSASISSGASASSITFYADLITGYNRQEFNVSASTGAETKYWYVDLVAEDSGGGGGFE